MLVVNAAHQGRRFRPYRSAAACRGPAVAGRSPRASGAAGPARRRSPGAALSAGRGARLHAGARPRVRRRRPAIVSRSGYTGEDGFEISVRGRSRRKRRPRVARRARSQADRPRRAQFAAARSRASASMATTSTRRRRRSKPASPGRSASAAAKKAAFRAPTACGSKSPTVPSRRRVGLILDGKVPAREGADIKTPRRQSLVGRVTSGGFGPTLGRPIAHGLCRGRLCRAGDARSISSCAASRWRRASCRCPSFRTAITRNREAPSPRARNILPIISRGNRNVGHSLHQGP